MLLFIVYALIYLIWSSPSDYVITITLRKSWVCHPAYLVVLTPFRYQNLFRLAGLVKYGTLQIRDLVSNYRFTDGYRPISDRKCWSEFECLYNGSLVRKTASSKAHTTIDSWTHDDTRNRIFVKVWLHRNRLHNPSSQEYEFLGNVRCVAVYCHKPITKTNVKVHCWLRKPHMWRRGPI